MVGVVGGNNMDKPPVFQPNSSFLLSYFFFSFFLLFGLSCLYYSIPHLPWFGVVDFIFLPFFSIVFLIYESNNSRMFFVFPAEFRSPVVVSVVLAYDL